jgi:hypothetical protein
VLVFGALGLFVTLGDTARLFLRAKDHSTLAIGLWGVWSLALVIPLAWAAREIGRPDARAHRTVALNYLVLGYGTAILALRIVEISMAH